jgi:hypothetical protein
MTDTCGGLCPPDPLGFIALRDSRGAGKRKAEPVVKPCPSIVPPPRCSGRSPALPYPPDGRDGLYQGCPRCSRALDGANLSEGFASGKYAVKAAHITLPAAL